MEILNFNSFKLLLEAEGDPEELAAAEQSAETSEPPAPEDAEATDAPVDAPATDTSSAPAPSAPATDPFADATLPPDAAAPIVTDKSSIVRLVLLDKDKEWHSGYDDGGGVKRFTEYEITLPDLDKWVTDNGLDAEKDKITQAIQGKKPMPDAVYDKLRKSLRADTIGKDRGDIDIDYDSKNVPSTGDLDVIFVKKA